MQGCKCHLMLKLGQFAMLKICENWLGLVNSCVYCAQQTHKIYQVLPYSVDFKAPGELCNPVRQYSVNLVSFGIKGL